jgi:hypothetical protein
MTKIIDRQTAREISDKIAAYVRTLEADYGVTVGKRSCRYGDTNVKVTIDCVLTADVLKETGATTPAQDKYDFEATVDVSLPKRGSIIKDGYGEEFSVDEWIPRGRKFQIRLTKLSNGKRYKFTRESIQHMKVVRYTD